MSNHKDGKMPHGRSDDNTSPHQVKAPNLIHRAKEEVQALFHHHQTQQEMEASNGMDKETKMHKKETHGTSGDIDEDTPIDKVKGPNIFERAKEEIEAIVEAIHPHKDKDSNH